MFSIPRTLLFLLALVAAGEPRCCPRVAAAQSDQGAAVQIPDKIPANQLPLSPVDRRIDLLGVATNIHSEADAVTYIDAILAKGNINATSVPGLPPLVHRLAVSEYAAISDPSKLIPEARITDTFNQLMDEWGEQSWTHVSVEDFHRFHRFKAGSLIPYSVSRNADGTVADTCRPVEAVYLLYMMSIERGMQSGPRPSMADDFGTKPLLVDMANSRLRLGHPDPDVARRNVEYIKTRNSWLQSHFNFSFVEDIGHLLDTLHI
jgi:hypothetical protein